MRTAVVKELDDNVCVANLDRLNVMLKFVRVRLALIAKVIRSFTTIFS